METVSKSLASCIIPFKTKVEICIKLTYPNNDPNCAQDSEVCNSKSKNFHKHNQEDSKDGRFKYNEIEWEKSLFFLVWWHQSHPCSSTNTQTLICPYLNKHATLRENSQNWPWTRVCQGKLSKNIFKALFIDSQSCLCSGFHPSGAFTNIHSLRVWLFI